MRFKILIALLFLNLCFAKAHAGWYECYNFTGYIDKYPIDMSVQFLRDGYFGEEAKKDYNIIGVYKYSNHNHPIRLEGKIDFNTNKIVLFELNDENYSAKFEFEFSKNKCEGVWTNIEKNNRQPLKLEYVSQVIDTSNNQSFSDTEVLMFQSLPDYYFTGLYSSSGYKAQMNKLNVIHKKTNKIVQTIDFSDLEFPVGCIMTVIYDNLNISNAEVKQFYVMSDVGRVGGFLIIDYNKKTSKFIVNPEPVIEGV